MLTDVFDIQCPHCGEQVEVAVAADVHGELVQECEECGRPMRVVVRRDEWSDPQIQVEKAL